MLQAKFEPISNREDWVEQCKVFDLNGALFDLTGATIVLAVIERQSKQQKLLASTTAGTIVIQGLGVFEFTFPVGQMRGLDASKAYDVGCTILKNGRTRQYMIGMVPVIDGIVP
jgi:hypothetical protein